MGSSSLSLLPPPLPPRQLGTPTRATAGPPSTSSGARVTHVSAASPLTDSRAPPASRAADPILMKCSGCRDLTRSQEVRGSGDAREVPCVPTRVSSLSNWATQQPSGRPGPEQADLNPATDSAMQTISPEQVAGPGGVFSPFPPSPQAPHHPSNKEAQSATRPAPRSRALVRPPSFLAAAAPPHCPEHP